MRRKSFKFSILLPEWEEVEPTWKKVENWFLALSHNLQRRYQKTKLDFQKKVHLPGTIKQNIYAVDGGTTKPTTRIHINSPPQETLIHVEDNEVTREVIIHTEPVKTYLKPTSNLKKNKPPVQLEIF